MSELVFATVITFAITALLSLVAGLVRVGVLNRFAWARRFNTQLIKADKGESGPTASPTPVVIQMVAPPVAKAVAPITLSAAATLTVPPQIELIGREREKDEIATRLQDKETNLIVLRGYGGVGKSALARHVYYDHASRFAQSRYWLDLRGGHVEGQLRRFLATLDLAAPDSADVPAMMGTLRKALADRQVLVVLDNSESLPGPTSPQKWVQELLYFGPPATVLVTTRAAITPEDLTIETFDDEDALEYFRVRLGWNETITAHERDAALTLTHALGGLAKALETTTSRMQTLKQNCATALARLEVNGVTGRAEIHATFAASYTLLSQSAQKLFRLLGICAQSGIAWEDLVVVAGQPLAEIEAQVTELVEQSLAEVTEVGVEMHPLIHDYALECANDDHVEFNAMTVAHVRHFGVDVGGGYQQAIREYSDRFGPLYRIDAALENVTLAVERAMAEDFPDPSLTVAIANVTYEYFNIRDEPRLLRWLEQAATAYSRILRPDEQIKRMYGYITTKIGQVYIFRNEASRALDYYRQAVAIFLEFGHSRGLGHTYQEMANAYLLQNDTEQAFHYYQRASDAIATVEDTLAVGNIAYGKGQALVLSHRPQKAIPYLQQAEHHYRESGDSMGIAHTLLQLGWVQHEESLFEESIALFSKLGSPYNLALAHYVFALHLRRQSNLQEGKAYLVQAQVGFIEAKSTYMSNVTEEALVEWDKVTLLEPRAFWW